MVIFDHEIEYDISHHNSSDDRFINIKITYTDAFGCRQYFSELFCHPRLDPEKIKITGTASSGGLVISGVIKSLNKKDKLATVSSYHGDFKCRLVDNKKILIGSHVIIFEYVHPVSSNIILYASDKSCEDYNLMSLNVQLFDVDDNLIEIVKINPYSNEVYRNAD